MAKAMKKIKKQLVAAKGKDRAKRRTEILEEERELQENITVEIREAEDTPRVGKREVASDEIIGVLADAIEDVYHEFGSRIDRPNAHDKAMHILRELRHKHGVKFKETDIEPRLCKEHA